MTQEPAIQVRGVHGPKVTELYLTASPAPGPAAQQAAELFGGIAQVLRDSGARILQERAFCAPGAEAAVAATRAAAYGPLDDGVPATLLHVDDNLHGPVAGAQVHAVVSDTPLEPLALDGQACGRIFRSDGLAFLAASDLAAPPSRSRAEQAQTMLDKAERVTHLLGGNIFSVLRTWMWLADLLAWYDEFNTVRNSFFNQRGLLNGSTGHRLPASTGIGAAPARGGACAMDMLAATGPAAAVEKSLLAGGHQGSAFDYGSAFSRAVRAKGPAGPAVYVSGTAAIDSRGRTEHIGDAAGQIADTISHVRAILAEMDCQDRDVVHAVAYCKTKDVERALRKEWADLAWPCVVAVCDICRPDLLFEVEATACPAAEAL